MSEWKSGTNSIQRLSKSIGPSYWYIRVGCPSDFVATKSIKSRKNEPITHVTKSVIVSQNLLLPLFKRFTLKTVCRSWNLSMLRVCPSKTFYTNLHIYTFSCCLKPLFHPDPCTNALICISTFLFAWFLYSLLNKEKTESFPYKDLCFHNTIKFLRVIFICETNKKNEMSKCLPGSWKIR